MRLNDLCGVKERRTGLPGESAFLETLSGVSQAIEQNLVCKLISGILSDANLDSQRAQAAGDLEIGTSSLFRNFFGNNRHTYKKE